MKVLLVQGSAERAGAERMLLYLVKQLIASGSVTPVVLFLSEGPFIEEMRQTGAEIHVRPIGFRIRQPHRWGDVTDAISAVVAEVKPDLVHANGEKTSIFAARAARSRGIPSIAWLHDAPGAGGIAGSATQWMMAHSHPTSVVTCSRWMSEAFNRKYGFGSIAITNGLDLTTLPSTRKSIADLVPEASTWPVDAVVVSHLARLQRWKGTHVFIAAAAAVARLHPEARFLVVGDALYGREVEYAAELRAMATEAGFGGRLVFTGFRPDALDLMMASDVIAHCSIEPDPFPTVILEAMVMGKAVVATRTGGADEAIEDEDTGLLVAPADEQSMTDAIASLIASPDLRASLGARARSTATERYDSRRMAAEFEDLYGRITSVPLAARGQP